MEEVLNVLNKMAPFLDKLHASTAKGAPEPLIHQSFQKLFGTLFGDIRCKKCDPFSMKSISWCPDSKGPRVGGSTL